MQNIADAHRMLDAFASVGANRFDVTFLDIAGQVGLTSSQYAPFLLRSASNAEELIELAV
jgi:hypothetical protein